MVPLLGPKLVDLFVLQVQNRPIYLFYRFETGGFVRFSDPKPSDSFVLWAISGSSGGSSSNGVSSSNGGSSSNVVSSSNGGSSSSYMYGVGNPYGTAAALPPPHP